MRWTNVCGLACLLSLLACSTASSPPVVLAPPPTPCPPSQPVIDRSFYKQPPACLDQVPAFTFKCTPDPQRAGYCVETFGGMSVDATKLISDQLLCAQRVAEWVRIEREARAGNERAS